MGSVSLARPAELDLDRITLEIGRDNPTAAGRWFRDIWARFELLSDQPHIGERVRRKLRQARCIPFGNYVVYYLPENEGILILRVIHGARDQTDLV